MRFPTCLQVLAFTCALALPGVAQEPTQTTPTTESVGLEKSSLEGLPEKIEALLAQHHEIDQLSGAVLVAENGKVVYQGAFGMANSDFGIPNSVDTKFRLASVTKQFTAMLILQLVQDGKLELDATLTRYLPGYPKESGDKVTLRNLLNHTSGIPNYTNRPGFMGNEGKRHYTVAQFVAEFCSDPLEFEPGTQFNYSNSGYFLLGAIAEAVSGKTYERLLRERIFEPLSMRDSGYDDQYAVLPGRATNYDDALGGRRVAMWMDMTTPYAAGALYSTVGDLWKWDQALRAKELLNGKLEQEMFTPGLGDYGFGWDIQVGGPNGPVTSHSGGMPGVSTRITRTPDLGRCVIVLCNSGTSAAAAATIGITDLLEGRPPLVPTRRGDYAVAQTVLDEGAEAGLALLARLPQVVRDEYIERDVNALGYQLVVQRRPQDAILIFQFLTTAYPESANTWDSLGEAHMSIGNKQLAIENYKKALELDPKSETAKAALEKLQR